MDVWGKALAATGAAKIDEKVLWESGDAPMRKSDATLTGAGFSAFEPLHDPTA